MWFIQKPCLYYVQLYTVFCLRHFGRGAGCFPTMAEMWVGRSNPLLPRSSYRFTYPMLRFTPLYPFTNSQEYTQQNYPVCFVVWFAHSHSITCFTHMVFSVSCPPNASHGIANLLRLSYVLALVPIYNPHHVMVFFCFSNGTVFFFVHLHISAWSFPSQFPICFSPTSITDYLSSVKKVYGAVYKR